MLHDSNNARSDIGDACNTAVDDLTYLGHNVGVLQKVSCCKIAKVSALICSSCAPQDFVEAPAS